MEIYCHANLVEGKKKGTKKVANAPTLQELIEEGVILPGMEPKGEQA